MDLSDFFITQSQAIDFATHLTTVIDGMYTTNFSLEESLAKEFGLQKKDLFLKLFREQNITVANAKQVQEFLMKVQDAVSHLSVVSLTLAFEPTDTTLKAFTQWFVFTMKKHMLFAITVDPHIIAGAKITYNGKFKDYSLTNQFHALVNQTLAPTQKPIAAPVQNQTNTEQNEVQPHP